MSDIQVSKNTKKMSDSQLVAVRASLMAFGTMASRITGFIRDMLIASNFDRFATDAFFVAYRLPNMFRRLLGEGSMAVSFIPVFVEQLATGKVNPRTGRTEAYQMACGMFTILAIILSVLTVLGIIFMEPVLSWVVSGKGFQEIPGKFELAVYLGRIMFSFVFLVTFYAYFMALLQSLKVFGLPALAPMFFNLCIIVSCLLPSSWFGVPAEVLAWGVIVGGVVQVVMLAPRLHRLGYLPKLTLHWRSGPLYMVFRSMGPGILGMGVLQFMGLVNMKFASRFAEGSHSYIYLADRVLELPLSLFAVSLGSALLPTLADLWARGEKEKMGETANHYMRLVLFVSIPCALGLWVLGEPIVEVLFMHKKFSVADAQVTGELVQLYAFTLLSASGVRVLAPAFYAIKNTWVPAVSSVISLVFHILIALWLMPKYGLKGLIASTVVSSFVNLFILFFTYRRFVGPFDFMKLTKSVFRFLYCGACLVGVTLLYKPAFNLVTEIIFGRAAPAFVVENSLGVQLTRAAVLMFIITLSAIAYFVAAAMLKVPEFSQVYRTFQRKLKRS